jgi:hypothetical protein
MTARHLRLTRFERFSDPVAPRNVFLGRVIFNAVVALTLTALFGALASECVVAFSIPVYNSWYRSAYTAQTGRITMRLGSEPPGGHAICLVGYQDNPTWPGGGYFILRDSWYGSRAPSVLMARVMGRFHTNTFRQTIGSVSRACLHNTWCRGPSSKDAVLRSNKAS